MLVKGVFLPMISSDMANFIWVYANDPRPHAKTEGSDVFSKLLRFPISGITDFHSKP